MKKRTSLNEGAIRRFMALAGTGGLSENFVDLMNEQEPEEEEEELELDDDPASALDMPAEEPVPELELDDDPAEEAPAAAGSVDVVSLVDAIANAIEQETGVSISTEESTDEEPMPDLADEEPMPELADEEPMPELADEEPPVEDEDLFEVELVEDDELVNEVLRRVARRLTVK